MGRTGRKNRRRRPAVLAALVATLLVAACGWPDAPRPWLQRAALSDGAVGSDAEAVFAEAYRLEQQAAFGQAAQYYNLVIERFPGSPLVGIAEERVARLGGPQTTSAAEPSALAPGDHACTPAGLYPRQARWCGVVRQLRYPYVLIEVTDLHLNAWYALWFSRSTCTGDQLLTWFSQGDRIWVPRTCLGESSATG